MAATTQRIQVPNLAAMEQTITSYIAQGFVVSNRTTNSAVLFKKKEFSMVWAIVGLLLCVLPLLIYLIVYSTRNDEMVEVILVP